VAKDLRKRGCVFPKPLRPLPGEEGLGYQPHEKEYASNPSEWFLEDQAVLVLDWYQEGISFPVFSVIAPTMVLDFYDNCP
jgi:hypothetical protein